jgi:hypothetical protein
MPPLFLVFLGLSNVSSCLRWNGLPNTPVSRPRGITYAPRVQPPMTRTPPPWENWSAWAPGTCSERNEDRIRRS